MERRFDLVVVGTGITSGVASRCRKAGWTIDSRPFGGTCALRGCLPKKILVGAAEAVHAGRDMNGIGVPARTLGTRFVGPTTLEVGGQRLTGRRVLIAARAMPDHSVDRRLPLLSGWEVKYQQIVCVGARPAT